MLSKEGIPTFLVELHETSFLLETTAMISKQCLRKAINVLMMSPLYFRLDLAARQQLIKEFCRTYLVAA